MIILFAASSNQGKLAEFRDAAELAGGGVRVEPLPGLASLPLPEEDGATFEENARKKAEHYSRYAPGRIFADDSGLEVAALGGAPGVLSARYSGQEATDTANNEKLLAALRDVPAERRHARFVCVIALAERGRLIATFEGHVEGWIADAPRGGGGFGYDPLFVPPELGRTFAELTPAEKLRYSHRGRAFRAMLEAVMSNEC